MPDNAGTSPALSASGSARRHQPRRDTTERHTRLPGLRADADRQPRRPARADLHFGLCLRLRNRPVLPLAVRHQDRQEAEEMLKMLSGRTHFVVTSIAVINSQNMNHKIKSTTTYVTFNALTDEQINYYIENFEPYDKAGSYGIQELPEGYVRQVRGSLDNVIGLPTQTLLEILKEIK